MYYLISITNIPASPFQNTQLRPCVLGLKWGRDGLTEGVIMEGTKESGGGGEGGGSITVSLKMCKEEGSILSPICDLDLVFQRIPPLVEKGCHSEIFISWEKLEEPREEVIEAPIESCKDG